MALSEYLLLRVGQEARQPDLHETLHRLAEEPPLVVDEPPEAVIRRYRDFGE